MTDRDPMADQQGDEPARTIEEAKPFSKTAREFGDDVARAVKLANGGGGG